MVKRENQRMVVGELERNPPRRRRQSPRRRPATASMRAASAYSWRRTLIWHLDNINQPEEVILASLKYSKYSNGNDKWVHRAKDECCNKLHVLIKPMLEQWAQLHDDPNCTQKAKMKKTQSAGIADIGASVLCSGTNLMRQLGLQEKNLINTDTVLRAANEAKLEVLGLILVTAQVVGHPNKKSIQPLYIAKQLKTLFLSSRTWVLT